MNVQAEVIRIVAEQAVLDPAGITADTRLDELGMDSLALVEAIFAIEETFDISVPFNANAPNAADFDLTSIASVTAGVERLIAASRG